MAGVSTKEIKNRIRSMESTKQITKAMEMVAASKLRKAQNQVLNSRPYFETLYSAIHQIVDSTAELDSPYLENRTVKRSVYVVIAGDRGLAGGYNSNILKLCYGEVAGKEACVVPVGKKAVEFFKARGASVQTEAYAQAESMSVSDCFSLAKQLCKEYKEGLVDEVVVGYTNFVSVLSQTPATLRLLPLLREGEAGE
ncbi:MAG: F0F1 ATP synthase subunit gamma, partial [Oscillibacter sp.]|nr:F0F1 ATP synthase subunit gamma [Oscillibacter sp.]